MSLPPSLAARQPGRIRPRLEPLQEALHALGNPQCAFPSILITGSNGKGSVAITVESILRHHGCAVGLYTSPHLLGVEERIRRDGKPISRDQLECHLAAFDAFPELTFFETLTGAAFLAFAEAPVGCAILEAGMGGRWDATRLAGSLVAGLTNVGTDHRQWLGQDRPAIAADKGAALAAAESGIIGPQTETEILPHLGADRARPATDWVEVVALDGMQVEASWPGHRARLSLPLVGQHQLGNLHLALALALAAVDHGLLSALEPDLVAVALARLRWPGRLTHHTVAGRDLLVDCAHNLEATRALAEHLRRAALRPNLLFSCLDDKPVEAMAAVLRPEVARVAVCALADPRAMPVERLVGAYPEATIAGDPLTALDALPDPVLVAGSIRLAGAVLEHAEEDPWLAPG